jgi:hypothetical protein
LGSITVLIVIGLIMGNSQGFQEFTSRNVLGIPNNNLINAQYFLFTYKYQSDNNLKLIYPRPNEIKSSLPLMEKYRWGVFSNNISFEGMPIHTSSSLYYNIDQINSETIGNNQTISFNKNNNSEIQVKGWAIDIADNKIADSVYICIDNNTIIPTIYSLQRTDVADHFKNNDLEYCGFWASFSSGILKEGNHRLNLIVVTKNQGEIYVTEPINFNIYNSM